MVYVGSDHGGFHLKQKIIDFLKNEGVDFEDIGAKELDPKDDYPQFAQMAVMKIMSSDAQDPRAVLVCRGGQGMAIAANRFAGIRASVVWSEDEAESTRQDNDSNVLCIPADHVDEKSAKEIVKTWLEAPFSKAPRHIRRLKEIDSFYGTDLAKK